MNSRSVKRGKKKVVSGAISSALSTAGTSSEQSTAANTRRLLSVNSSGHSRASYVATKLAVTPYIE